MIFILTLILQQNMGEVRDINKIISKKTTSTETSNKRPRNETPTPSPAFKVYTLTV